MAKIQAGEIVNEALLLLNEVGLDALTTRRLAQRLGVESPTLYWHFKSKAELHHQMSSAILLRHHVLAIPQDTQFWRGWLAENTRSFRRALLAYRDGARLHAGSVPDEAARKAIARKIDYLVSAGIPKHVANMVMYSLGQFTIGCVLEEQAIGSEPAPTVKAPRPRSSLSEQAFEFGVQLFIDGLEK